MSTEEAMKYHIKKCCEPHCFEDGTSLWDLFDENDEWCGMSLIPYMTEEDAKEQHWWGFNPEWSEDE